MQDAKIRNLRTIAQLCRALVFSYIGSVSARHSSSGVSQTVAFSRGYIRLSIFGRAAIALGIGQHSTYHYFSVTVPGSRPSYPSA